MQVNLFNDVTQLRSIPAPDADLQFSDRFLASRDADEYLRYCLSGVSWRQDEIVLFGKSHPLPRLQQWYGDPNVNYAWSGILMNPLPWTPELISLKTKVERASGCAFNSVLLNLYRNGQDTVAWHSDDEPALGKHPVIASLSLGAERDFIFRHRHDRSVPKILQRLTHGSLLVMSGDTQSNWEHSVPRRRRIQEPRVNLTFRKIDMEQEDVRH